MAYWSDLSQDLLHSIGQRLESHFDVLHFRSVCTAWRSAIPLNLRPLPTLYFFFHGEPQIHCVETKVVEKCVLIRSSVCLFKSEFPADHGHTTWLGLLRESESGFKHIVNPIEGGKLPSMVLDISKLDVQVLGLEYLSQTRFVNSISGQRGVCVMNVNVSPDHDDEFYVLKSHFDSTTRAESLCLFKTGEEEFIRIRIEGLKDRTHYIPFKRKFYVVDSVGTTFSIEPSSGAKSLVSKAFTCGGGRNYLVESPYGKLLLIELIEKCSHFPPPIIELKVYELDEEKKIWVHLESLGDMILFLREVGCKFFVRGIPDVGGNCIVFYIFPETYVFNLSTKRVLPLARCPDLLKLFPPGSSSSKSGLRIYSNNQR